MSGGDGLGAGRITTARIVFAAVFLVLAARAAHLSVFDERGLDLGRRQANTAISLAPERGAIFDRNGHELALSIDSPSIYAIPSAIEDIEATSRALGKALGRSPRDVASRISGRQSYVFLARWVKREQAERVRELDLRGIGIVEEPRRVYPTRDLAAQLVGFANIDGHGVRGVEQLEDAWLRGRPRRLPVERDGSGELMVATGDEQWRTAGGDVTLTLDAAMQSVASMALAQATEATGARGGLVVSLDPHTGDVLALAESPSFDPNRFRELRYSETRSRSFLDALEPGSTLKAFLVAAALESGSLTPADRVDCEDGEFPVPGKVIRDTKPHGVLSSADILRVSSNIGAVKIAMDLGAAPHVEMLRRFGFGVSTGSGFPEESAGLLRGAGVMRPLDQAALAFGQGLSVTAVQLAAATAVLANGGQWMRPRLVRARRSREGDWAETRPESVREVLSERTARSVLDMLETVTGPGGTGRRAALAGVRVAGKTGTAQKFDTDAGRYSQNRFVAWFIGVVPADAPRLVIVAALDEPKRPTHTGGAAAAPLFARVAAGQLARLGILTEPAPARGGTPAVPPEGPLGDEPLDVEPQGPPSRLEEKPEEEPEEESIEFEVATAAPQGVPLPEVVRLDDRLFMPDFRGLSVTEVRTITAREELSVEMLGEGRAVDQDPPPGTIVRARGDRMSVRFAPGAPI